MDGNDRTPGKAPQAPEPGKSCPLSETRSPVTIEYMMAVYLLFAALAFGAPGFSVVPSPSRAPVAAPAPEYIAQEPAEGGDLPPEVATIERLLSSPLVQSYMKVLTAPQTRRIASDVVNHPNRFWLAGAEILWVFIFIFFRAWRLSKGRTWLVRTWTGIWTFGLFWVVGIFARPWGMLFEFDPVPVQLLFRELVATL